MQLDIGEPRQFRTELLPYLGSFVNVQGIIAELRQPKKISTMVVTPLAVGDLNSLPEELTAVDHSHIRIDDNFFELLLVHLGEKVTSKNPVVHCHLPVEFRAQVVAYRRAGNNRLDLGLHRAQGVRVSHGPPLHKAPPFTYEASAYWVARKDEEHLTYQSRFRE